MTKPQLWVEKRWIVEIVTSVCFAFCISFLEIKNVWNNRVWPLCEARPTALCGIIISCFFQSRLSKTFSEICFCWKMRVKRRIKFGSKSCRSAQVLKKQDILGTYQHLPFLLISCSEDNNRKLRTCLCPTCVSSFPIADFCDYIQSTVYILWLKTFSCTGWVLLNWGTGAYIQGSFLSTCLSTICCV